MLVTESFCLLYAAIILLTPIVVFTGLINIFLASMFLCIAYAIFVYLQAARNRYRSFYGAAKAAEQLGDREMAKNYYQKLLNLCNHADTERPELAEAEKYLTDN